MEKHETAQIVAVLCAGFPNHPTKPETVHAYHLGLGDLPYRVVNAAVAEAIRTLRFFPTVAELRSIVADRLLGLPSPEEAWGEVMGKIRDVGSYGAPAWSSEAVRQAVRAIGWRELCLCDHDDLPTMRAHFYRTFEAYRVRALRDADLGAIAAGGARPVLAEPPRRGEPVYAADAAERERIARDEWAPKAAPEEWER